MALLPSARPRIEVWVLTHDRGAWDATPWIVGSALSWGASIEAQAPPFAIMLADPAHCVVGPLVADRVVGTAEQRAAWRSGRIDECVRCGDWVVIRTERQRGRLSLAYVGVVDARPVNWATDGNGATPVHYALRGTGIAAALLDWELLVDARLAGLPGYFDVFSAAITSALVAGAPGRLLAAVIGQAQALGGGYPAAPPPPPSFRVTFDFASEVSTDTDGGLCDWGLQVANPFERHSARSLVQEYLGLPALTEAFLEPREDALRLVYREHPWDRAAWLALPVLAVDPLSADVTTGSGAVYNRILVRPAQFASGGTLEWGFIGQSPVCPVLDLPSIRRYGVRRLEPVVRWGDSANDDPDLGPRRSASLAWMERWNRRLWAWHALGDTYLSGTITTRYRPDATLGARLECRIPGRGDRPYSFYVEGYTHDVSVDPSTGAPQGTTSFAVTRGQRGADGSAYATPPDAPEVRLRGAEEAA